MASEKGRENERKGKDEGGLKASRQKETLLMKEITSRYVLGFYSQTPFTKYQKNQKQKLLQGTKKCNKKVKTSKSRKGEWWHER